MTRYEFIAGVVGTFLSLATLAVVAAVLLWGYLQERRS